MVRQSRSDITQLLSNGRFSEALPKVSEINLNQLVDSAYFIKISITSRNLLVKFSLDSSFFSGFANSIPRRSNSMKMREGYRHTIRSSSSAHPSCRIYLL